MTRRIARSTRVLSVLTMAAAGALLNAQTAPSTHPSTQPATAPAATQPGAVNPATAQPVTVLGSTTTQPAKKIVLEFKDAPIDAVLDYLSEVAGFIVSKEGPVDGKVNITSRGPVSAAEALTLLNAALKPSGFTAIQSGRILRVGRPANFKKQDIPVFSGTDPDAVPQTDDLVTWVIPVKNIDAAKLRQDLVPLVSGESDFTANQGSNSLVLTDTTANIHRIVAIVAKLDQQQALSSDILIKSLKFANAAAAAKLILTIFGPEPTQNQQQGGPGGGGGPGRFIRQMLAAQGGGGGATANPAQDSGKASGKVTAAADDRTNTIIVVGPTGTLTLIKSVLATLDEDPTAASEVKVFQLNFADASSAAKLIKDVFQQEPAGGGGNQGGGGQFGGGQFGGGRIAPIEGLSPSDRNVKVNAAAADRTNTLVVTAPPDTLRLISQILKSLDEDPAAVSMVKVFQLTYADSASAAKLLTTIFQGDPTQPQQSASNNPGGLTHLPALAGLSTSLHGGRVTAVSDDRTNTVVVTAPIEAMKIATGILEKLDSNPSAESALFIYHLRNGVAADIQATLSTLFGAGGIGGTTTGVARNTEQTGGTTGTTSTGGLGSSSAGRGSSSGFGGSGSTSGFGSPLTSNSGQQRSAGQGTSSAAATGANIHATSELIGQVIVVADSDTNSLIVSTARKYQEQVKKIIMELDRPVPQVLIKVLVAEVTRDRTDDLGIDFSILDTRASGKGLTVGQNNGNVLAGMQTPAGLVATLMETNLSATLHALAVDNKLDVLSRPYILASDNQPASITIGQEVPFITNTQITETGQQINTITYQAVGIILNVTPHINPDGAVTLDVAPQISAISATTVPIGNGITAPVIDNRSAQSRVTIRNGNTIVIGGMMQDQKTTTLTKIPLLGDIPYLGTLFTRSQTDRSKTELLIFLTPHLAQQPESLKGMSEDELKTTKETPTMIEPGAFDTHWRGMQHGKNPTTGTSQPSPVTDIVPTPSTKPFTGITITPEPPPRKIPSSLEPGK